MAMDGSGYYCFGVDIEIRVKINCSFYFTFGERIILCSIIDT